MRFKFYMYYQNLEEVIVCANIELVRFGVIAPRPLRENKKFEHQNSDSQLSPSLVNLNKNSGPSSGLSFAMSTNVTRFLKKNHINAIPINRLPNIAETRAKLVDDWVKESINSKIVIDILDKEHITADENNGNIRTQSMQYITVSNL